MRPCNLKRLDPLAQHFVAALIHILEIHDPYTLGHECAVSEFALAIGRSLAISEDQAEGLCIAGLLHDIGKLMVPAEILCRPRRLTPGEFAAVREHAEWGARVLDPIAFPWPVAEIILQHHERMDGSGYPHGLAGEAILLEARILAVADVVESMVSHRPYRPALGLDTARAEILRGSRTLYDPEVVTAAVELLDGGYLFATLARDAI